jgi:hypothetical protein
MTAPNESAGQRGITQTRSKIGQQSVLFRKQLKTDAIPRGIRPMANKPLHKTPPNESAGQCGITQTRSEIGQQSVLFRKQLKTDAIPRGILKVVPRLEDTAHG